MRQAFAQCAKAELKLFAVFIGTALAILVTAGSLVTFQGTVNLDMEFYNCSPKLTDDLKIWIDEQASQDRVRVTPDPLRTEGASTKSFHLEYRSRSVFDLYGGATIPQPFLANCQLKSYTQHRTDLNYEFGVFTLSGQVAMDAVIALLVFIALRMKRQQLVLGSNILAGMRRTPLWPIALALCTASIAMLISYVAQNFGFVLDDVRGNTALTDQLIQHPIVVAIFGIAAAPFFEELLFRRWVLQGFMEGGFPKLGSIFTSVNFALAHFGRVEISTTAAIYFALIFSISLALCWVYIRTRNLWASTAMHATHNALALCLGYLFDPSGN